MATKDTTPKEAKAPEALELTEADALAAAEAEATANEERRKEELRAESDAALAKSEADAKSRQVESSSAGSEIAAALVQGLKDAKGGNFELQPDEGVEPRFSLVKNKEGEVMIRENETGHLSQLQLKSIEEKEASIQDQEVEEI